MFCSLTNPLIAKVTKKTQSSQRKRKVRKEYKDLIFENQRDQREKIKKLH